MDRRRKTAHNLLQVIPLVMRRIGSRLRNIKDMPSSTHFGILFMLSRRPMNLSEMAREHNVSLPTMSNSVSTLVQHDLVRRTRSEHDRRQVVIELTPNGREILAAVQQQATAFVAEVLDGISDEELDRLADGITVLQSAFFKAGGEVDPAE